MPRSTSILVNVSHLLFKDPCEITFIATIMILKENISRSFCEMKFLSVKKKKYCTESISGNIYRKTITYANYFDPPVYELFIHISQPIKIQFSRKTFSQKYCCLSVSYLNLFWIFLDPKDVIYILCIMLKFSYERKNI